MFSDRDLLILEKWKRILPRLTPEQKVKALAAAEALCLMTEYEPEAEEKKGA